MRITARKKAILSYFDPHALDFIRSEIGLPPYDVPGIAYLLNGGLVGNKKHQVESARRTLESMVKDGLLERVTSYERRQDKTQGSAQAAGVWCKVSRYGLPGQVAVVRDSGGSIAIEGEWCRVE